MKIPGQIKRVYFIGAGGIGMSAVARYFKASGLDVAGYDRVSTPLTDQLSREGIHIHFTDDIEKVPPSFKIKEQTLIVYTPAIPVNHAELKYFRKEGFLIMKRSEILGSIMEMNKGIAVAGTHGKTTVSSMIAHIMNGSKIRCNAFLGGVSKNLDSNLLLDSHAEYTIAEADEFDRSFLRLYPELAVVTSMDPDHLDIYGSHEKMIEDYNRFISQIKPGGILIHRYGLPVEIPGMITAYSYDLETEESDFYIRKVSRKGFNYQFDLATTAGDINNLEMGIYGKVNLENAVAAIAACLLIGAKEEEVRKGMKTYSGVKRRFDIQIESEERILIDDYAHHPEELNAFILSVREALPGKLLTGVFQPHLFSRTKDFAEGFSDSLSRLDNVILLDIYPAREEPVPGVSSKIIYDKLKNKGEKIMTNKEQLLNILKELNPEVLLMMGAGDIDQLIKPVKKLLSE